MSLNRFVLEPKSYVVLALGIRLPLTEIVPPNTGEVSVLLVNVSVVFLATKVSVAFGIVTVLSCVGSTTVKVVS